MIPRLYLPFDPAHPSEIAADERAAHYLMNVLRRNTGDPVVIFNGRDGEYQAEIAKTSKRDVKLRIVGKRRDQDKVPDLWLCFAPLKKDATDCLIEKGTELGAAAFWPVHTQRTNAARVNLDRLRANAIEAAEQTQRMTIPEIKAPANLPDMISQWPGDRRLILCDETGRGAPVLDALAAFTSAVSSPNRWAILCGPEGGFDATELDRLHKLPFCTPVGLGPRILRADTAVLTALAVFQSVLGDGRLKPPPLLPPVEA